jgi:hypothetical protein
MHPSSTLHHPFTIKKKKMILSKKGGQGGEEGIIFSISLLFLMIHAYIFLQISLNPGGPSQCLNSYNFFLKKMDGYVRNLNTHSLRFNEKF